MPAFPGKRLGVYELEEELGRGAMGVVYRGRQMTLDRVVAVKVLLEGLVSDESFVTRFIREARLVASLNHPNIVHVYDAGRSENLLYFAMEYISGPTVTQLLRQKGKLPVAQAMEIGAQVAAALEYAHVEARMVHRDIKPENMMLDRWGKVKVVDFGLARVAGVNAITRVGTVVGSLYYVSPEQLLGRQLDGRADVYALGVALYEMITGKRPFVGKNLAELSRAILMGPLEEPSKLDASIPASLEAILLRALARDRDQRYSSAGELEEELRRWAASSPAPERKESALSKLAAASAQADAQTERKQPGEPRPDLQGPVPPAERKGTAQQTPAAPASQSPNRSWSALGKPRGDPSLPPITLRPLPQSVAQPPEPRATPEPERAPHPPAKLPDKSATPPKAVEEAPEDEEPEDPNASDLLKSAATQLQRLVWRLKKE
ncbi:MAG TPA: protein kinase [Ktedonobacterales bacterium]|nr:protein kinase [Ktedonobacterales bacterium]